MLPGAVNACQGRGVSPRKKEKRKQNKTIRQLCPGYVVSAPTSVMSLALGMRYTTHQSMTVVSIALWGWVDKKEEWGGVAELVVSRRLVGNDHN